MSDETISNQLKDVKIDGPYIGGDNINLTAEAVEKIRHDETAEKFGLNARSYIASVAKKIVSDPTFETQDFGLDFHAIKEKFSNLKCSQTYIVSFNKAAQYFNEIDKLKESDALVGGEVMIRTIEVLITKLYSHYFSSYSDGDNIHNAILGKLLTTDEPSEQAFASDVLIYYTIRECGIFNDKK